MEPIFASAGRCPLLRAVLRFPNVYRDSEAGLSEHRAAGSIRPTTDPARSSDCQEKVILRLWSGADYHVDKNRRYHKLVLSIRFCRRDEWNGFVVKKLEEGAIA